MAETKKLNPTLAVFITVFIDLLGVGIIIPIFAPLIVENKHGMLPPEMPEATRNIIYGLLTATFPFFQFFGAPILGTLADKHGRKKILRFTLVGTFTGYILFALAIAYNQLWLLFIARAIPGFMGGNISIVTAALADISAPKDRAKNFGLIGMAFGMGFILGPAIGGFLSDPKVETVLCHTLVGWLQHFSSTPISPDSKLIFALVTASPLWFTALLTLVNLYYVTKQFPETFKPVAAAKITLTAGIQNLRKAFKMANMWIILITVFLQSFAFSFFMQFNQVFLIKKFHYAEGQIGMLFGYIGLWIAFTQGFIIRHVSKRFAPPAVLRITLFGLAITLFVIMLPNKAWILFLTNPFIAIFQGLTQPNQTSIISNLTPAENQGEMLGIQQSITSLAFTIPPLIGGFLININYHVPLILSGIVTLGAWLVFFFGFNAQKMGFKLNTLRESAEP